MSRIFMQAFAWLILALGTGAALWKSYKHPEWLEPLAQVPPTVYPSVREKPQISSSFISSLKHTKVHSASVTSMPGGGLMAAWFAGSVEGGSDVKIYTARYQNGKWSVPRVIVSQQQLEKAMHRNIRRIGNPLIFMERRNHLWCFFVTTSLGGWSTASINLIHSSDDGNSWTTPKRLVTTPFLNMSTLLRNPPLELPDGGLLIPVYHEFLKRFPELLQVSGDGRVISKRRIADQGIQPVLTSGTDNDWYAFVRSRTGSVIGYASLDGARSWTETGVTGLPNPDSAVLVERIQKNLWLAIGNFNKTDRSDLSMAYSRKLPAGWKLVSRLEFEPEERFSYPAMVQSSDGFWHLLYSWKENNIKHIRFNLAWLENRISQ